MAPSIGPNSNNNDDNSPLLSPWEKNIRGFLLKVKMFSNWRYLAAVNAIEEANGAKSSPIRVEKNELVPYITPSHNERNLAEINLNEQLDKLELLIDNMIVQNNNESSSNSLRRGVQRRNRPARLITSLDLSPTKVPSARSDSSNMPFRKLLSSLEAEYFANGLHNVEIHGRRPRSVNDALRPNPDIPEDWTNMRMPLPIHVPKSLKPPHQQAPPEPVEIKELILDKPVSSISDLLTLLDNHPLCPEFNYAVDLRSLHTVRPELEKLDKMIGMKSLKKNILDQILFYAQGLSSLDTEGDFMHTVIYGPPGTGKTEVAKLMGNIFCKVGLLKKGTFRKVTRADLVAGYLGQTTLKTRDIIKESLGGVLFIDEAYALGNQEKRDSFAKEAIDALCEALSDYKSELMVIIAGYEKELSECFFNYNPGLESRFTWRFRTEDYSSSELKDIFMKKISETKWIVNDDHEIQTTWFDKNMSYFKYFGRDMETLLAKVKIAHSRRIFGKSKELRGKITHEDMEEGLNLYLENDEVKKRNEKEEIPKDILCSMYS